MISGIQSYFQSSFFNIKCSYKGKVKTPGPPFSSEISFNVGRFILVFPKSITLYGIETSGSLLFGFFGIAI